eukprot:9079640-Alexandrium_andersonii.AAC.1
MMIARAPRPKARTAAATRSERTARAARSKVCVRGPVNNKSTQAHAAFREGEACNLPIHALVLRNQPARPT